MSSRSSFIAEKTLGSKGFNMEMLQNVAHTVMSQVTKIQTTLYDLVAVLNAELSSDEDSIITATIVQLLSTYRVTCTGALQGYRLVCNDRGRPLQTPPKGYECFSQFESYGDHCERLYHRGIP